MLNVALRTHLVRQASEGRRSAVGPIPDLYSHVLPGMKADAAERVDAALQAAIKRRSKDVG